jgi:type I site-specific restriction endonuclease
MRKSSAPSTLPWTVDNYVITEADTCLKYVLPKLYAAGWNDAQISEQKSFTDGRKSRPVSELEEEGGATITDDSEGVRRKYFFDGGRVEIAAHLVYELDPDGRQLRVVRFSEYAAEKVRTLYPSAADLRKKWADPALRAEIIAKLEERGIDFDPLREASNQPEADAFDLLCHLAFNGPLRTRRERADRVRKEERDYFDKFGPQAKAILTDLLEKYAEHRNRAIRDSRRAQIPAGFRAQQCHRDRKALRRPGGASTSSSRASGSALRRIANLRFAYRLNLV